jgi:hypothetical protein
MIAGYAVSPPGCVDVYPNVIESPTHARFSPDGTPNAASAGKRALVGVT